MYLQAATDQTAAVKDADTAAVNEAAADLPTAADTDSINAKVNIKIASAILFLDENFGNYFI